MEGPRGFGNSMVLALNKQMLDALPLPARPGIAMDDSSNGMPAFKFYNGMSSVMPDTLIGWYASQSFIGYQLCAIVAQQWLVDKACTMPARDAIRHGYDIHVEGLVAEPGPMDIVTHTDPDTDGLEAELVQEIREQDKFYRLRWNLEQFVRMGRIFGIRVAFFKVESADPLYYEKPFNPDGITPNSYKGIVQVDPYWCVPQLDMESASDPTSVHFYEPTWWTINGRKYHRSHLCIFRNSEPPDVLKPMYNYGGVSVPQKIMERVYAAERTANEGPQLAMTKRTLVWKTDVAQLLANQETFAQHMENWVRARDNYGVKLVDIEDTMEQFDTALSDLDETIMTQFQLVAAASNVPATKLLGTTPKGFNSSGDYEESSYHEELEAIQANDLDAFLERHYTLLMRSYFEPRRKLQPGSLKIHCDWAPVDSPTAEEYATINKTRAETDNLLVTMGAIDGMDVRNRLKKDNNSDYTGLADPLPDPTPVVSTGLEDDPAPEETAPNQDPAGVGGTAQ